MSPRTVGGAPPSLVGPFVRYIRSFSVTVGIGLAPFLGKVRVPLFDNLLEVVPFQLQQHFLIPLSALLMGLVAVSLQFYAGQEIAPGRIRSLFGWGLAAMVVGLVLFTTLSIFFVERLQLGGQTVGVVIADSRLKGCKCPSEIDEKECITRLSLNEAALDSCWGGTGFKLRKLSLSLTYLFLTGGFASLVALLLVISPEIRRRRESVDAKPAPAKPRRGTKERSGKEQGKGRPGARRDGGGPRAGRARRPPAVDDPGDRR